MRHKESLDSEKIGRLVEKKDIHVDFQLVLS